MHDVLTNISPDQVQSLTEQSSGQSASAAMQSGIPAKEDPVFKRFFRMLHVGVPEPAVKLKMQAEGLDPEILRLETCPVSFSLLLS